MSHYPNTQPVKKRLALPTHLEHQPIFAVPYEAYDGKYAGDTDAYYLSIGASQWDDRNGKKELSAKVLRYATKGDKWSRQSEELPLHRPIDLTLLLVLALNGNTGIIPAGTFHEQTTDIAPILNHPGGDFSTIEEYIEAHPEEWNIIVERLEKLYDALGDWKARR